ncbi:MAG: hypothetical protein MUE52_08680 [Tabrizicola sp.]|nr:hypothetical protein [Tabrizicola sp.]
MTKKVEYVAYMASFPENSTLVSMISKLQTLMPGAVDRYEIVSWGGKERRGKFEKAALLEKLESLPENDVSFLSVHTRMQAEDANVPKRMIKIARCFLEDSTVTGVYIYVPLSEVDDVVEFCSLCHEAISLHVDPSYAFGVLTPLLNADFDYGPAQARYVDRKSNGYWIVDDLNDRLMRSAETLNPVLEGHAVRSVYPINFISVRLVQVIQHILTERNLANSGSFLEVSRETMLWTIPDAVQQKAVFKVLSENGMTLEADWFEWETYKPRFATTDDMDML